LDLSLPEKNTHINQKTRSFLHTSGFVPPTQQKNHMVAQIQQAKQKGKTPTPNPKKQVSYKNSPTLPGKPICAMEQFANFLLLLLFPFLQCILVIDFCEQPQQPITTIIIRQRFLFPSKKNPKNTNKFLNRC
jgi:hypothetical protein